MSEQEIENGIMELPESKRLDLARRIIASVTAEQQIAARIEEAVPGIVDIITGKIPGLTEAEFRAALE